MCARDARPPCERDNGVVDVHDTRPLHGAARRLLAGRVARAAPLVAVALLAAFLARHPAPSGGNGPGGTAVVLNVLALLPLLVARRWPSLAAAAATLVTVAILRQYEAPLAVASFGALVFVLVQLVIRRGLLLAVPLLLPFLVFAVERHDTGSSALGSTAPLLILIAALAVGESLRRRGLAVAALGASREAMAASDRARTAMEERARIARELHDIVAHHLSVIAIESEVARLTSPELSAEAGDRLEAIAATAREALTETRRLLGVLREDTFGEAERSPQPGLGQLGDLIDTARAAGTPIHLERQGSVARLPLSIDLAAYRIVQEALTNARRHAPGADVDVEVAYRPDGLHLRIRDHGPGVPGEAPVAGHGLMGMHERATLAGGSFVAGPASGGGFEVDVTLPIAEATAP